MGLYDQYAVLENRLGSIRWPATVCLLHDLSANVPVWWSCLSTTSSPSSTIQKSCINAPNACIQYKYEFCPCICWVAFWRHNQLFQIYGFKKEFKICLSAIGKMYIVCAILRNALTCLCGNSTSNFFQLDPPSLQEYFVWTVTQRTVYCLMTVLIYI
jgi:hypothetical protein